MPVDVSFIDCLAYMAIGLFSLSYLSPKPRHTLLCWMFANLLFSAYWAVSHAHYIAAFAAFMFAVRDAMGSFMKSDKMLRNIMYCACCFTIVQAVATGAYHVIAFCAVLGAVSSYTLPIFRNTYNTFIFLNFINISIWFTHDVLVGSAPAILKDVMNLMFLLIGFAAAKGYLSVFCKPSLLLAQLFGLRPKNAVASSQ